MTSTANNVLCTLDDGLLSIILKEYLTIKDWCKLDSALCTHHVVRQLFLEALKSDIIVLKVERNDFWTISLDSNILEWIVERNIHVKSWDNNNVDNNKLLIVANSFGLSLQSLNVSECDKINDNGLRYIVNGIPNLKKLDIHWCEYITDVGFAIITQLKYLQYLDISRCNITDVGLMMSITNNNSLIYLNFLDISYNLISDSGINYIVKMAPNLQILDISKCWSITDEGILSISYGLNELMELNISKCTKCTDKSLFYIINGTHKLDYLGIIDCRSISYSGIDTIKKSLPKLRIIVD